MVVLEVSDVLAAPKPSLTAFFVLLHGKNAGHHSVIEQRVRFPHVYDIDFDIGILWRISYSKIEPLRISFCVEIVLKQEIVFIIAYLKD